MRENNRFKNVLWEGARAVAISVGTVALLMAALNLSSQSMMDALHPVTPHNYPLLKDQRRIYPAVGSTWRAIRPFTAPSQ